MQYAFEQLWCSDAIEFWSNEAVCSSYEDSTAPETPDSGDVSEIMKAFNMDSPVEADNNSLFDLEDPFEVKVQPIYYDCFENPTSEDCAVEEPKKHAKPLIPVTHFFSPHLSQDDQNDQDDTQTPRTRVSNSSDEESNDVVSVKKKPATVSRSLKRVAEEKAEKRATKKQKTSFTGKKNKQPAPIITDFAASDLDAQNCCCLSGCSNAVTNRLRFSLRRPNTFKEDFVAKQWNKICQYHYFSDLYQHKKSLNH